ncbi:MULTISPECIES: Fic family protein [Mannheimia]|uniref:Fic family protein n=1 Tax=Mannheimia pernigra TaxID=111844 RepID=A0ABD7A5Y8_9PAST|nr:MULTISPECIES: Fic family protein [Mannheimia]QLB41506.1 Fic family protein [Mannheimia pernigra]QTM01250.1 DUF4172 domain-containing protein [Mannheimia sp. ZY171111]QTM01256.1 DUF4172 domain-containing protein [Mannheimia sp. ZY171111]
MQYDNYKWIWQYPNWTEFSWDNSKLEPKLRRCWLLLGKLIGYSSQIEYSDSELALDTLLSNILSSSQIEGENLNAYSVRSSLARKLNISIETPCPVSDRSEGVSNIMIDVLENWQQPLSFARLAQWHLWLFPYHTPHIKVGEIRGEEPMQVVSGRLDKPKVHFEALPRQELEVALSRFIEWFNSSLHDISLDPLIRAGICNLWFLTIHPFDDGNGRLARALTDLTLTQADQQSIRLYAFSFTILQKRNEYYRLLEESQKGSPNITQWLSWFLTTLIESIESSLVQIERLLAKSRFWLKHRGLSLNKEQKKVLNRLLDGGENGFELGINASQYQKVAKVSKATATRHLTDLLEKGLIRKTEQGGRSTRYLIEY